MASLSGKITSLNIKYALNVRVFMWKDLKYLAAYLVPFTAYLSFQEGGAWSFLTVLIIFVLVPLMELAVPASSENVPEEQESTRSGQIFFDILLYLNIPLVYGLVLYGAYQVSISNPGTTAWFGWILNVGIVIGSNGINVAHELGHRPEAIHQRMAKILLLPAFYQHFFIEHNQGHHKLVATNLDPASAAKSQNLYSFWLQSIIGSWKSAWKIEAKRLERLRKPALSIQNECLQFGVAQLAWLVLIGFFLGEKAVLFTFLAGIVGVLLLETVNYIEHYGLRRNILATGRPEPVGPRHSWNSNHELGRILLYELTRHSDHHYKSNRKYQVLRHIDEGPQLPTGYPGCMVLALFPPLWFAVIHPRLG